MTDHHRISQLDARFGLTARELSLVIQVSRLMADRIDKTLGNQVEAAHTDAAALLSDIVEAGMDASQSDNRRAYQELYEKTDEVRQQLARYQAITRDAAHHLRAPS